MQYFLFHSKYKHVYGDYPIFFVAFHLHQNFLWESILDTQFQYPV